MFNQFKKPITSSYYSLFFSLVMLLLLSTPALAKPVEVGRVLMATTGVTAQQPGTTPRAMARRSAIYLGDTLKTPEGGRAQLRMADGEMISLTAASELMIEAFEYNPEAKDAKDSSVKRLVTGGLRTITGAVKGDGYEMKSRAGTIGIRGTAFEVYSQQGENLFVRIQSGNVFVQNAQGSVDIGVNQRLSAARISGVNLAPEAISTSDLPSFFEDAFTEDTTLSLAVSSEEQQDEQQEQQELLQEVSDSVYEQPAIPVSTLQVAQAVEVQDIEDKAASIENKIASSDLIPTDPGGSNTAYSGYVTGMEVNLSGDMTLLGSYFEKSITSTKGDGTRSFTGQDGKSVLNLDYIDQFTFADLKNIIDNPDSLDGVNFDNIDFRDPSSDFLKLALWTKYSLGTAEIFEGIKVNSSDILEGNLSVSGFVFSDSVLELSQLNKIKEIPGSDKFTYNILPSTFDEDFFSSGKLIVNFIKGDIAVSLLISNEGFPSWGGSGKIKDFYNSEIKLNEHGNNTGSITGRFVGSKAEGAITSYSLQGPDDHKNGIAVFSRVGEPTN